MTLSSGLRYDQERTWILVPSILKINYCEITSPFPILLISIVRYISPFILLLSQACFSFEHFLDNAFLVRRKTFPKESYLMLFFDKLDRKYLSLNMQIFYTTVWNIFSLGESYHQELFFTLIKKKLKNITCLKTTWWFATSSLNKTNVLIIAFVKFLEIFIFFKLYKLIYKTARKNQLTRHICRGDNMILSAILRW